MRIFNIACVVLLLPLMGGCSNKSAPVGYRQRPDMKKLIALMASVDYDIKKQLIPIKRERRVETTEKVAMGWTNVFLASEYVPPQKSRYIFLPRKQDADCDAVRISYSVANQVITISQTSCIFAVQIEHKFTETEKELLPIEKVQAIAQKLFKGGVLKLAAIDRDNGIIEGISKPQKKTAPWLNSLFWWQDYGRIGFYFIKDDGYPSCSNRGMDLGANAYWFTKPKGP